MRYARVEVEGTAVWASVDGADIEVLEGSPYQEVRATGRRLPLANVRLLPPVRPSKIFCLGRNYEDHILEMGYTPTSAPSIFLKPPTTIIAADEDVVLPPVQLDDNVEHEAELAIVIGRRARNVSAADAASVILGYTIADDVSARTLQRSDPNNTRGKGFDTFCPVGPWIETDLDPVAGVRIRCSVNGELRQDGLTTQMIYNVPALIEHLSAFSTLLPGDLILTGSPGGTARMAAGDRVEIEIDGIGVLRHGVVANQD